MSAPSNLKEAKEIIKILHQTVTDQEITIEEQRTSIMDLRAKLSASKYMERHPPKQPAYQAPTPKRSSLKTKMAAWQSSRRRAHAKRRGA